MLPTFDGGILKTLLASGAGKQQEGRADPAITVCNGNALLEIKPVLSRDAQLSDDLANESYADISAFVHRNGDDPSRLGMNHAEMLASWEGTDETKLP